MIGDIDDSVRRILHSSSYCYLCGEKIDKGDGGFMFKKDDRDNLQMVGFHTKCKEK